MAGRPKKNFSIWPLPIETDELDLKLINLMIKFFEAPTPGARAYFHYNGALHYFHGTAKKIRTRFDALWSQEKSANKSGIGNKWGNNKENAQFGFQISVKHTVIGSAKSWSNTIYCSLGFLQMFSVYDALPYSIKVPSRSRKVFIWPAKTPLPFLKFH